MGALCMLIGVNSTVQFFCRKPRSTFVFAAGFVFIALLWKVVGVLLQFAGVFLLFK